MEEAGIIAFEARKQGQLAAACDDYDGQPRCLDLREQLHGAGHTPRLGTGVEEAALLGIDVADFLFSGIAVPVTLREEVDGGSAGAALVHVSLFGRHLQPVLCTHPCPRAGVIGHRVEEYAVHVEQHSLGAKRRKVVLLFIFLYRVFVIHVHIDLSESGGIYAISCAFRAAFDPIFKRERTVLTRFQPERNALAPYPLKVLP